MFNSLESLTIPALLVALGLGIFGAWRQKKWFAVAAAFLLAPVAWVMTFGTDFGLLAWLLPLSLLGSAFAIQKGIRWLTWVLLLPLLGILLIYIIAIVVFITM